MFLVFYQHGGKRAIKLFGDTRKCRKNCLFTTLHKLMGHKKLNEGNIFTVLVCYISSLDIFKNSSLYINIVINVPILYIYC